MTLNRKPLVGEVLTDGRREFTVSGFRKDMPDICLYESTCADPNDACFIWYFERDGRFNTNFSHTDRMKDGTLAPGGYTLVDGVLVLPPMYPLHEKAKEYERERAVLPEFLDFLQDNGWLNQDEIPRFEEVIGRYIDIDAKAFSDEKDKIYEEIGAAELVAEAHAAKDLDMAWIVGAYVVHIKGHFGPRYRVCQGNTLLKGPDGHAFDRGGFKTIEEATACADLRNAHPWDPNTNTTAGGPA